jgi:nicotinamide-nucleotide amidase
MVKIVEPFDDIFEHEKVEFGSKLDFEVADLLKECNLNISVAESITGGMLSERITAMPGSSNYFLGGLICYNNRLKVKLCGVSPVTIRQKGVISAEVAKEMAKGVKKLTDSDIAISTTGVAGPPNHEFSGMMTGKVYMGFIFKDQEKIKLFKFEGSRDTIRKETTGAAFMYLRQYLKNYKKTHTAFTSV